MYYPEDYFEDSVIDGFYVPSMMKKAWAAQLEVLDCIDAVCKKHGIRWWADCGTLLGAVRHGGYIPWDDDLDICMFRDDLQKFTEAAAAELPDGFDVQNVRNNENYDNSIVTRVLNKTTVFIDDSYLDRYHGFPFVAGVDIFALDYVAPNPADEEKRLKVTRIVSDAAAGINKNNRDSAEARKLVAGIENLLGIKFTDDRPVDWQLRILKQDLYAMYTGNPDSEYVALMSYWMGCGSHKYPVRCFEDTAYLPFERMMMPVPACFDRVLSIEYGNYMKICRSGGVHDYPFYTGMKKQLFELLEYESPYVYKWNENDIRNAECEEDISPEKMMTAFLGENEKMASTPDMDAAVSLQKQAIELGTVLESMGHGGKIVAGLEKYCEEMYELYNALAEGNDCRNIESGIKGTVEEIKHDYGELHFGREVVFVVWKASMWPSMEKFYRQALDDHDNNVYVIAVPYYYRKADGTPYDMNFEGEMLPSYVHVTDREKYDFKLRHPSEIYINYPYDQYNDYITVENRFYSSVLKKYTDSLVYISPFVTDEIDDDNERAIYNMQFYVTAPAVVNADKVYVQSEHMKKMYVRVLSEWAEGSSKDMWEDKISVSEPFKNKTDAVIPQMWEKLLTTADRAGRRTVLFTFNISTFEETGIRTAEKLIKVLETFEKRKDDVLLWWFEDDNIQRILPEKHRDIWEKYIEIVTEYRRKGFGIYDDSKDYRRAADMCDAYYGSPGMLAARMNMAGKPVMIADVLCDS